MRALFALVGVFLSPFFYGQSLPSIGGWREHLPYHSVIDLAVAPGVVYAATPYSLFSIDQASNQITRMSRITGLHETGVSAICYDNDNDQLLIAYTNSNIDILRHQDVINLPDIKRDDVTGDKRIYSICTFNGRFYLSTGIGVIVVDGARFEISASWFIGHDGQKIKVNGFAANTQFFYAATVEGLKRVSATGNPADYHNWEILSGKNGLAAGDCRNVFFTNGKLITQQNDSLFLQNGDEWTLFFANGLPIASSQAVEGGISVCQRTVSGEGQVTLLNTEGSIGRILQQPPIFSPQKCIVIAQQSWIADSLAGLLHVNGNSYESIQANSPGGIALGDIAIQQGIVYAASGGVDDSWNALHKKEGLFRFTGGEWETIDRNSFSALDSFPDVLSLAIDPRNESVWAGSFGGGLLHWQGGSAFEVFKQGYVGPSLNDPTSYRVTGLAFDVDHRLWASNFGAAQPLLLRQDDGSWLRFSIPYALSQNGLGQMIVDDNNYVWIVAPQDGGLLCYDHGASIDRTDDDLWKFWRPGAGNGNLPQGEVRCVAQDKSGFIWVGTSNGIGVIQCAQDIFTAQGCEAILPVVTQGNFGAYLFSGEDVRSIAVDGADRKWVATAKGVWLISATGEKVIDQFTEENSPLLSNDVKRIAIDQKTGEIFFATAKGICSFRSTATDGTIPDASVLAFPNPVPPGFTGTIGIRGLPNNAVVKITEMNGRLVYQTRALGGQAVWNGKDYTGRKIATGVYLILVSGEDHKEKTAGKIVFISR